MTNRHRQNAEENLEELRKVWETDGDLEYLRQALSWARGVPLPDWLTEALRQNLGATMPNAR